MSARTVLLAEDDPLVRGTIANPLEDAGFKVVEVGDGEEAISFLERGHTAIAALVSDIRMPRLDGLDLARLVAKRLPDIAIVLVSGYPMDGRLTGVPEGAMFVSKPFRADELARAVDRAVMLNNKH